jgi:MFS family permease
MEEKVEILFATAGNAGRFQYIILFLTFAYWINVDIIPISLPYLEKNPLVNYTNTTSGEYVQMVPLNYTICESGFNYVTAEKYNFSLTSEFGKECDKIIVSLIGSLTFIGSFIGSATLPLFTNNIGRKNTVLVVSGLFAALLISSSFFHDFTICIVALLVSQMCGMLTCLSTFMNVNEITSVRRRPLFGSIISSGYSICGIIYIFLYKLTDSWRINFIISASVVIALGVIYLFVAIESPRFYLLKGNFNEFMNSVRRLADKNGRLGILEEELNNPQSDIYIDTLRFEFETTGRDKEVSDIQTKQPKVSVFALVTHPAVNKYFLISCILWFTASGNYYGITIDLKNLPGDVFINGILLYVFEILSCIFASFAINTKLLGRKGTIIFYEVIAVAGYVILFFFDISGLVNIILVLCCRFAVTGIFTILYTYSLEIYPTPVRALGFGINSAAARVSSMICPFLIELVNNYISLIFACLNLLCLLLMFLMPETLNKPLLDTMPEIGKKETSTIKDETLLTKKSSVY